jgi:hypothetical protein
MSVGLGRHMALTRDGAVLTWGEGIASDELFTNFFPMVDFACPANCQTSPSKFARTYLLFCS